MVNARVARQRRREEAAREAERERRVAERIEWVKANRPPHIPPGQAGVAVCPNRRCGEVFGRLVPSFEMRDAEFVENGTGRVQKISLHNIEGQAGVECPRCGTIAPVVNTDMAVSEDGSHARNYFVTSERERAEVLGLLGFLQAAAAADLPVDEVVDEVVARVPWLAPIAAFAKQHQFSVGVLLTFILWLIPSPLADLWEEERPPTIEQPAEPAIDELGNEVRKLADEVKRLRESQSDGRHAPPAR